MPRVYSVVARAAKRSRSCTSCGQSIEVGQAVYYWTRRNWPKQYQHVACGRPKPSQLYSRKTAQIEDMLIDADFTFSEELPAEAQPGETYEVDTSHVEGVLGEIADVAESVGDEYEESADAMPEGLQQGYQAEALRDVAERLRSWADELRDVSFDTTVDFRELEEGEDPDNWRDEMQGLIDEVIDSIVDVAQQAAEEIPEYEG